MKQLGRIDLRYSPACISLNSLIPLLNGSSKTLKQLIEDHKNNVQNWTYSINEKTHEIVPGKIVWAGETRKNAQMVKVVLDDGNSVETTLDHKFIMRDGTIKEAQHLQPNDSLMPLYRKISTNKRHPGYEMIYDPATEKYITTHKMVAEDIYKKEKQILQEQIKNTDNKFLVIHHKDFNKKNNEPSNLKYLGNQDHLDLHASLIEQLHTPELLEFQRQRFIKINKTEEHRQETIIRNKELGLAKKMGEIYNHSILHKEHNEIRSKAMTKYWSTNKEEKSKIYNWNIPEEAIELGKEIYKNQPKLNRDKFIEEFKKNKQIKNIILNANTLKRDFSLLSRQPIEIQLKKMGYSGFTQYKSAALGIKITSNGKIPKKVGKLNHKVKEVIFLNERQDTGCITVEGQNGEQDRHNFAVHCGHIQANSLIYIRNSIEEDYWLPVRGDKSSRIEPVAGGQYTR